MARKTKTQPAPQPVPDAKKRYNLVLPGTLYDELETIANAEQTTVLEVIKRCIKLGLIAHYAPQKGARLLIEEADGRVREIVPI